MTGPGASPLSCGGNVHVETPGIPDVLEVAERDGQDKVFQRLTEKWQSSNKELKIRQYNFHSSYYTILTSLPEMASPALFQLATCPIVSPEGCTSRHPKQENYANSCKSGLRFARPCAATAKSSGSGDMEGHWHCMHCEVTSGGKGSDIMLRWVNP